MVDNFTVLLKLDHEGMSGLEWFKEEEFEDRRARELFSQALGSYIDAQDDLDAFTAYLEEEDEVHNSDS